LVEVESNGAEDNGFEDVQQGIEETFVVSAYCKENYPHICNDGDSTYTATGTIATSGRTVAVDPKFIPYGTKIEIEGTGVRIAEDCGGAIKGENRIDLLVETHQEALEWGIQTRKVKILK
jgi:3D (Asp-Asp-Asp) domain-containing protein